MHFVEEHDNDNIDDVIAVRFLQHISRDPSETIRDNDARVVFDHVRHQSNTMVHKSAQYAWLLEAVNNDKFITFYLRYIQLLCNVSHTDYLTHPKNQAVSNFIKLQMIVWNITDKSDKLCFKLDLKDFSYYLFQLLKLPQLHPSVCLIETNARLVAHSSIGVLHNLINHVPNIRSSYRKAHGVRVLTLYVTGTPGNAVDRQSMVQYLALRTAALLVLSFIVDETENESLHADDSHIVYLLAALDDALNCSGHLYSTKYGYQAQELLVGLKNLAGPDRNKTALIKNGAMKHVEAVLIVASEMKFPYTPKNAPIIPIPHPIDADILAEKALEFLWSLSFVPESHPTFTPGSAFRRLFEKFATDSMWSSGCRRVAQGILWNLPSANLPVSLSDCEKVTAMMASERRQPRRNGHLMISYQHSTKNIMIKVRDQLTELGYSVWMDVDYASGSFVDAMALGIEKASALILGLSQAFKNSPHCRQEVKYAYNLGIPLFPLQLEPNFNADGWLGLLLATIIYIPVTDEIMVPEAVRQLQKQLGDLGHKSRDASQEAVESARLLCETSLTQSYPGFPVRSSSCIPGEKHQDVRLSLTQPLSFALDKEHADTAPNDDPPNDRQPKPLQIRTKIRRLFSGIPLLPGLRSSDMSWSGKTAGLSTWKPTDVCHWLEQIGLSEYRDVFSTLDGQMLAELCRLRIAAPDSLSVGLYRDCGMKLVDQLRLFVALSKLADSSNLYTS